MLSDLYSIGGKFNFVLTLVKVKRRLLYTLFVDSQSLPIPPPSRDVWDVK